MYRILRNNKEQGPYNLDELVQLNLRPYDLIWVEGKSASWRYPSEIDVLKPYLPGESAIPIVQKPLPDPVLTTPFPTNTNVVETVSEEVPEITEAILEQKANAIYQRIQAYNAQNEQQAKDVQTKYARSLEDLKQDYADWLHGKKRKKREQSINYKGWVAFGAVSAAFILFILAGKDKETLGLINSQKDISEYQAKDTQRGQSVKMSPIQNSLQEKTAAQLIEMQAFVDSMRTVLQKQETKSTGGKDDYNTKEKNKPVRKIEPQYIQEIILPLEEPVKRPSIKAADLDAHYILGDGNNRVKDVKVTVHNNGTVMLKQVTVDVFYYKKGEKLLEKETLHFSNIGPGNSFTLAKPGNKKASYARFELGQLVAEL